MKRSQRVGQLRSFARHVRLAGPTRIVERERECVRRDHRMVITIYIKLASSRSAFYFTFKFLEGTSQSSLCNKFKCTDSILPRCAACEHGRCQHAQSIFSLSVTAFWWHGLASSIFIFAPILLCFFYSRCLSIKRAKIRSYTFRPTKKVMLRQS